MLLVGVVRVLEIVEIRLDFILEGGQSGSFILDNNTVFNTLLPEKF
jgi:hypothetical protein